MNYLEIYKNVDCFIPVAIPFEELTLRYWTQNGNKGTGAEIKMEVIFHHATQPISADILHRWQTIATVGQRAGK